MGESVTEHNPAQLLNDLYRAVIQYADDREQAAHPLAGPVEHSEVVQSRDDFEAVHEKLRASVSSLQSEVERLRADEYAIRTLREIMWLNHGCIGAALYGDDGELQCQCRCDWRRDPIRDLIDRYQHARWALAARTLSESPRNE